MSYVVLTELGFKASPDVTMVDTTWVKMAKTGGHYGGVPEQAHETLRAIADVIEESPEATGDELILEALREVTDYLLGEK